MASLRNKLPGMLRGLCTTEEIYAASPELMYCCCYALLPAQPAALPPMYTCKLLCAGSTTLLSLSTTRYLRQQQVPQVKELQDECGPTFTAQQSTTQPAEQQGDHADERHQDHELQAPEPAAHPGLPGGVQPASLTPGISSGFTGTAISRKCACSSGIS